MASVMTSIPAAVLLETNDFDISVLLRVQSVLPSWGITRAGIDAMKGHDAVLLDSLPG